MICKAPVEFSIFYFLKGKYTHSLPWSCRWDSTEQASSATSTVRRAFPGPVLLLLPKHFWLS